MSASPASGSRLTRSAADGPSRSMRMSSGPSCRNEKPRAAAVELHRRDADVEHHPVERRRARFRGDAVELAEAPLPQLQPAGVVAPRPRPRQRLGVAVDADHPRGAGVEQRRA